MHDHHEARVVCRCLAGRRCGPRSRSRRGPRRSGPARRARRRPRGADRRTSEVADDREVARAASGTGALPERIEATSPSTAVAVSIPPAPGPDIVISVIAGASTMTALNGPSTGASGCPRYRKHGKTRTLIPSLEPLGDAQQLQREAQLLGVGDVVGLDLGDPLVGDVVELHRGVEGEPREDRHLRRGVGPADVVAGIGLGEAQLLGPGQHLARSRRRFAPSRSG